MCSLASAGEGSQGRVLTVNIDTTNTENALVECRFMLTRYSCTIVYGKDPSYTNLVYGDTSTTEEDLQTDTTYTTTSLCL